MNLRRAACAWRSSLIFQMTLPELAPRMGSLPHMRCLHSRLPRFHRAGPSTSLDKSVYSIVLHPTARPNVCQIQSFDAEAQSRQRLAENGFLHVSAFLCASAPLCVRQ